MSKEFLLDMIKSLPPSPPGINYLEGGGGVGMLMKFGGFCGGEHIFLLQRKIQDIWKTTIIILKGTMGLCIGGLKELGVTNIFIAHAKNSPLLR